MKTLYNLTNEYNVFTSRDDKWLDITDSKYIINNNTNFILTAEVSFGDKYYCAMLCLNNIFNMYIHRDQNEDITILNKGISLPNQYLRDNDFHKVYIQYLDSNLIVKIDNTLYFNGNAELNNKEIMFRIMSHDDVTRIKNIKLDVYDSIYLIEKDNKYYSLNKIDINPIEETELTKDIFKKYGTYNINDIIFKYYKDTSTNIIDILESFNILIYKENE